MSDIAMLSQLTTDPMQRIQRTNLSVRESVVQPSELPEACRV